MISYVVGFLFSPDHSIVVLIRKNRPVWQVGWLNGVGGHVESGETNLEAMRREFREEAGLDIEDWTQFCTLEGEGFQLAVFSAISDQWGTVQTVTDELVKPYAINYALNYDGYADTLPSAKWMIQMALAEPQQKFIVKVENR